MSNDGIVNIHGKEYMTVARRVELAHEDKKLFAVETEVLSHNPVVIKATVKVVIDAKDPVDIRSFTGISAANPNKSIEKQSPYEVAETSAVGRALGFAGYGIVESIASADEMVKASSSADLGVQRNPEIEEAMQDEETAADRVAVAEREHPCRTCGAPTDYKEGTSKQGRDYKGFFCTANKEHKPQWLY